MLLRNLSENRDTNKPIEAFIILKDFPLKEDKFHIVEDELRDTGVFRKWVEDLSKLGGNNYKETSRRILKRVLDDQFFKTFSLHEKIKTSESSPEDANIVGETRVEALKNRFEAVHKNFQQYSLKDIEIVIGIWLSKCNERLNKKGLSQERPERTETPDDDLVNGNDEKGQEK
ncbi:unnamed protein product [Phaedon cochleariae]|uniref:Uncharacterized protein n=1 Tax=Phaedon cochleariae TaxID=80249 RepID=A0A9N9SGK8_PHACE|nr:unnamed protein product [Phaedon cochleariae]